MDIGDSGVCVCVRETSMVLNDTLPDLLCSLKHSIEKMKVRDEGTRSARGQP